MRQNKLEGIFIMQYPICNNPHVSHQQLKRYSYSIGSFYYSQGGIDAALMVYKLLCKGIETRVRGEPMSEAMQKTQEEEKRVKSLEKPCMIVESVNSINALGEILLRFNCILSCQTAYL